MSYLSSPFPYAQEVLHFESDVNRCTANIQSCYQIHLWDQSSQAPTTTRKSRTILKRFPLPINSCYCCMIVAAAAIVRRHRPVAEHPAAAAPSAGPRPPAVGLLQLAQTPRLCSELPTAIRCIYARSTGLCKQTRCYPCCSLVTG